MSEDLSNEGSVNFWIRINENPAFKDLDTNLTFMNEQDVGGVKITVVKEKSTMRVIVNNLKYGISKIASDITKKSTSDMMVTITWDSEIVTLYLNSKKVSESVYT